jgi:selenocysteine-specific translation elongation factor
MFEMTVEDVFTIDGVGTVFAGRIGSGSIAVGDPVVCRTRLTEIPVRVIAVRDPKGNQVSRGEAGATVGVVCNEVDLASLSDSFSGDASNRTILGVTLASAPKKKRWWQS